MAEKPRTRNRTVSGTVDRIEGDTIVVVVQHGDDTEEIAVNRKDLQKTSVKPGDKVSIKTN